MRIQDRGSGIFLTLDPGSGEGKFGSGIRDKHSGSGIRDKHPGSVTLLYRTDSWMLQIM